MTTLTATSHALLGLIALSPASAHVLATRMLQHFDAYWPRAASKLYEEVKKLHAAGLVDSSVDATKGRSRAVYRINVAGTAALSAWLAAPGAAPELSFEALLKVQFADLSNLRTLSSQLQNIRDQARLKTSLAEQFAQACIDGTSDLPQRAHVQALVWRFLWDHHHTIETWATWALHEIAKWPHTDATEPNLLRANWMFRSAPGIKLRAGRARPAHGVGSAFGG